MRADFELAETYRYRESPPLPCPITALAGRRDNIVADDEIRAWESHTTAGFALMTLDGGHYLVESAAEQLLAVVGDILAGTVDA